MRRELGPGRSGAGGGGAFGRFLAEHPGQKADAVAALHAEINPAPTTTTNTNTTIWISVFICSNYLG